MENQGQGLYRQLEGNLEYIAPSLESIMKVHDTMKEILPKYPRLMKLMWVDIDKGTGEFVLLYPKRNNNDEKANK